MKKIIICVFLLNSCSNMSAEKNHLIDVIDLSENLSFIEFKNKIIKYAQQSNYPDIN